MHSLPCNSPLQAIPRLPCDCLETSSPAGALDQAAARMLCNMIRLAPVFATIVPEGQVKTCAAHVVLRWNQARLALTAPYSTDVAYHICILDIVRYLQAKRAIPLHHVIERGPCDMRLTYQNEHTHRPRVNDIGHGTAYRVTTPTYT